MSSSSSADNFTPVFDGHNDVLLRLWSSTEANPVDRFINGEQVGHIDLPRAKKGGLAGGLCAIYVPSPSMEKDANGDYPTPEHGEALRITLGMAALLAKIEAKSNGGLKICRDADDIRTAMANGAFASVLHIEGAEAISADLDELYVLHQAGLRTLGPVWSRPNIFAYGVPFRFPSTPDIGPGLSDAGKALIRACNELKIMVDLSHMNDKGFWDIAAISDAPLVASHSNVHTLCTHSRNVTEKQMDAIKETGGLMGINFGVSFLREDGQKVTATPLSEMVRHIDYIINRIGVDHVALGSDFDGTTIPDTLASAADLQLLIAELRKAGYDQETIDKIAYKNWIRVLEKTWA
ncbi:dipeptidase [Bacillus subtilis]|uniref:dipeptidase n=1 Tax=Pseudochrobactrum asaccharolyticum TaxID=354351 RepID=UPI001F17155A|nr:dipeptidase [Pseudochrobactrum asaccharolyticum]MCF7645319.1 dipeptidase [Pseudochrobactrum asaccharolyticum]MCF7671931.1 dipeptidase [Bacillus subtilis]